jgi:hypothetical protein
MNFKPQRAALSRLGRADFGQLAEAGPLGWWPFCSEACASSPPNAQRIGAPVEIEHGCIIDRQ